MKVFSSWSGGKDSALALYYGLKRYKRVDYLFTMLSEDCIHSRAHGLSKNVLQKQSESLGIPLITKCSSWKDYEKHFLEFLKEYVKGGIGIFGDIDLQEHLDWVTNVCSKQNVIAFEPLWKRERIEVVSEFLSLGFKAKIIAVKKEMGIEKFLGKDLSLELVEQLKSLNIDPCGENGEFHTFVYDGPIFKEKVDFNTKNTVDNGKTIVLEIE